MKPRSDCPNLRHNPLCPGTSHCPICAPSRFLSLPNIPRMRQPKGQWPLADKESLDSHIDGVVSSPMNSSEKEFLGDTNMSPYTCLDCGKEYRTELALCGHLCAFKGRTIPTDAELSQAYEQGYADGRKSMAPRQLWVGPATNLVLLAELAELLKHAAPWVEYDPAGEFGASVSAALAKLEPPPPPTKGE